MCNTNVISYFLFYSKSTIPSSGFPSRLLGLVAGFGFVGGASRRDESLGGSGGGGGLFC